MIYIAELDTKISVWKMIVFKETNHFEMLNIRLAGRKNKYGHTIPDYSVVCNMGPSTS